MIEKWLGKRFESSTGLTPEFERFAKNFKAYIKKNLPDGAELIKFSRGHFYVSGFIKRGEKYVHFMSSDVRFFQDEWYSRMLLRAAKNEKDFSGGQNYSTSMPRFKEAVDGLLKM